MVDYYALLTRAVASLADGGEDIRYSIYERARISLENRLRSIEPAMQESAIAAEIQALDEAIQRIEQEKAVKAHEEAAFTEMPPPPAPTTQRVEKKASDKQVGSMPPVAPPVTKAEFSTQEPKTASESSLTPQEEGEAAPSSTRQRFMWQDVAPAPLSAFQREKKSAPSLGTKKGISSPFLAPPHIKTLNSQEEATSVDLSSAAAHAAPPPPFSPSASEKNDSLFFSHHGEGEKSQETTMADSFLQGEGASAQMRPILSLDLPQKPRYNVKSLVIFGVFGVVIMMLVAGLAFYRRANLVPPPPKEVVQDSAQPEPSKREVRITANEGEVQKDAQNAEKTNVSPSVDASQKSKKQRALLVVESQNNETKEFGGTTTWSFGDIGQEKNVLRCFVEAPLLNVEINISKNNDPTLKASHIALVTFTPRPGTLNVKELANPEWRENENQAGGGFSGKIIEITKNTFLLAFDPHPVIQEKNRESMRQSKFLVFEFGFTNGKAGAVLIEKGGSGEQVINEALAVWK